MENESQDHENDNALEESASGASLSEAERRFALSIIAKADAVQKEAKPSASNPKKKLLAPESIREFLDELKTQFQKLEVGGQELDQNKPALKTQQKEFAELASKIQGFQEAVIRRVADDLRGQREVIEAKVREANEDLREQLTADAGERQKSLDRVANKEKTEPAKEKTGGGSGLLKSPVVLLLAGLIPGLLVALVVVAIAMMSGNSNKEIKALAEQIKANGEGSKTPATLTSPTPSTVKIDLPQETLKDIQKAVRETPGLGKDGSGGGVGQQSFNTAVTELKTLIENNKGGGLPQDTITSLNDAAKALKDFKPKSITDLTTQLQTQATKEADSKKALDNAVTALNTAAGKIGTGGGATAKPQDVWFVGLDTAKFPVIDYKAAFSDALATIDRKPNSPRRAGFAVARTGKLTVFAKPTDPMVKWDDLQKPPPGVAETPAGFGGELQKEIGAERAGRKVILVASADCPPLEAGTPGWEEIPEVHVVLVQVAKASDPNDRAALADRLLKWQEFCQNRQGSLTVIPEPVADKPARLREVLKKMSKPE